MKTKKLKNWSIGIFHFTFGQLVYSSEGDKEAITLKNQIDITIQSQFNVLMAYFFTKYISLFAND